MAKAKARQQHPKWVLDDGVGVEWTPNKHGWGAERQPAVAVMHHPIKGMSVHGPFLDEDAAHAWIRKEGSGEVMDYYGDTTEAKWFVMPVYVPTHQA